MEQILEFIEIYGLPVFVIASIIIAVVGILKLCKVFGKINNSNVKKFIYYVIDIILSFGCVAIYFAVFKIDFTNYIAVGATQISATTTLYAIYENLGARKIVQLFWKWLGSVSHKDKYKKLVKIAKQLGIETVIEGLKDITLKEAEKLEAEKQEVVEQNVIEATPVEQNTVEQNIVGQNFVA